MGLSLFTAKGEGFVVFEIQVDFDILGVGVEQHFDAEVDEDGCFDVVEHTIDFLAEGLVVEDGFVVTEVGDGNERGGTAVDGSIIESSIVELLMDGWVEYV